MEQQLAVISQPTELQAGFKPWSKGLGSLLLQDDADGRSEARAGAIRLIAINPTLRAEAERLLPRLEEAKAPASREEIISVVMREMPAWGVSQKHAGEFGVTYASYADALEGLSLYAVEEGVARWNRAEGHEDLKMGGFPPRPAQLFALANEGKRELYMAAYRAKLALEWAEEKVPRQVDPEEAAKVDNDFRALASTLKGRAMPEATKPRFSQHELAAQLRRSAPRVEDDAGEVL
jgi:hypothetical protein